MEERTGTEEKVCMSGEWLYNISWKAFLQTTLLMVTLLPSFQMSCADTVRLGGGR